MNEAENNIEEEIRQRMESLRSYCAEHGRQLLIIADTLGTEDGRYVCVWSISNSKHKEITPQNFTELMGPYIHSIDSFVKAATGESCMITSVKEDGP